MKSPLAAVAALAMIASAAARDKDALVTLARESGQWADSPAAIREWFRSLMQPDVPWMSSLVTENNSTSSPFLLSIDSSSKTTLSSPPGIW